jgi:hypothetical protein
MEIKCQKNEGYEVRKLANVQTEEVMTPFNFMFLQLCYCTWLLCYSEMN